MLRLMLFVGALMLPVLACSGITPQITAPTQTLMPIATPTQDMCAGLTEQECINSGTHSYTLQGVVEGEICFYSRNGGKEVKSMNFDKANPTTINFSSSGISVQGVLPDTDLTLELQRTGPNTYSYVDQYLMGWYETAVITFTNTGFTESRYDHSPIHPSCQWEEVWTLVD